MTEETKEVLGMVLDMLKNTLVQCGVSMALYGDKIAFFDTETYLNEHKFSGVEVSIDELVKE